MSAPILATKLYIPRSREAVISRPRLLDRLNRGRGRKLTLVSAPAGFGKTTLISSWIAQRSAQPAWLSLDAGDGDPERFLAYVIAALQTAAPGLGTNAASLLSTSQPLPRDVVLTTVINDAAAAPDPVILVLDDYHLVDAPAVDEILIFLLDHLPPNLQIVITTREDPPLPLARLRARGQMNELRAADLRFTRDEAAAFLTDVMGITLAADEIAALEERTEGWIAGLQLAALSMQDRDDLTGFVQAFAGDNRYIVDYLVEEVLHRQPRSMRAFLLQTSILQQLSGPLCDAVTGGSDGKATLHALDRSNLFVSSLDDTGRWYRYHQLFADVLYAHLQEEDPDQIAELHRRACRWYDRQERPIDAVRHGLAARDFATVADLLARIYPDMERSRQIRNWLTWAEALPQSLVEERPVLSVAMAWAALDQGEFDRAEQRLQDAERWLSAATPAALDAAVPDELAAEMHSTLGSLPASVAAARTYLAQARGDLSGTLAQGRQALALLPPTEHARRGIPASLLALAEWSSGDLPAADAALAGAIEDFKQADNAMSAIIGAHVLGEIRMARGRLQDAHRTIQEALALVEPQDLAARWASADLHARLCELHCEWNDLRAADEALRRSKTLGEEAGLTRWRYRWLLVAARIQEIKGNWAEALALLTAAEEHYVRGPVPDVRPVAARRARVQVARGNLDQALRWARSAGVAVNDAPAYLREYEQITLARVLLAQPQNENSLSRAVTLLTRLHNAAAAGARWGSAIEILTVLARAYRLQGDESAALAALEQAVTQAAPEGYVRVFVDEGPHLAELMAGLHRRGVLPDYTRALLAAFAPVLPDQIARKEPAAEVDQPAIQPLVDPLSDRELDVLHLIAAGLSNREISEQLVVALSTVKGHNRNIFDKLQVRRRTEAVARARELGLL